MKNKTLIPVLLSLCLISCSRKLFVEGYITEISANKVTVDGYTFTVQNKDSVWLGKWVTFKGVRQRDQRINSKRSN